MKYIILTLMILFTLGCSRSQVIPQPTIFNPNLINGVDSSSEEPTEVTEESVVFLGDSLTHIGWWRSYFPDVETSNKGIGGNTTLQVLDRLEPIVAANPKKIFLLIGANDYNFGLHKNIILMNYEKILQTIKEGSPETKVYVQTIMPFGKDVRDFYPMIRESYKSDILEINFGIARLADAYGYKLLNTYAVMVNEHGDFKEGYSKDRIHLELPGYNRWTQFLETYVYE